ncbi:GH-E family nuclease [Saccharopolyspora sp. NPDC050389]|uniref:GH-E family nuclease n=1 Tax=Saccharopolyspora sp. NPDC050389 TaxID=3155516 RepID=UPI0033CF6087
MADNPLVVTEDTLPKDPNETPDAFKGVGILESYHDVTSLNDESSWVEAGLAYGGAAMEVASMVMDPIGTLASYGVSFLIEHVQPLKEALDWFAGDPDGVKAYGATWQKVSEAVKQAAEEYNSAVQGDTAQWTGSAGDAYRKHAEEKASALSDASELAGTLSTVVTVMGEVVSFVREFVRDLVADCVSRLITYALEALCTFGLGTPVIVAQATAFISKTVSKISEVVQKLVKTIKNVAPKIAKMVEVLGKILKKLGKGIKKVVDAPGKLADNFAEGSWKKFDDAFGTNVVGKHNTKTGGGPNISGDGGSDGGSGSGSDGGSGSGSDGGSGSGSDGGSGSNGSGNGSGSGSGGNGSGNGSGSGSGGDGSGSGSGSGGDSGSGSSSGSGSDGSSSSSSSGTSNSDPSGSGSSSDGSGSGGDGRSSGGDSGGSHSDSSASGSSSSSSTDSGGTHSSSSSPDSSRPTSSPDGSAPHSGGSSSHSSSSSPDGPGSSSHSSSSSPDTSGPSSHSSSSSSPDGPGSSSHSGGGSSGSPSGGQAPDSRNTAFSGDLSGSPSGGSSPHGGGSSPDAGGSPSGGSSPHGGGSSGGGMPGGGGTHSGGSGGGGSHSPSSFDRPSNPSGTSSSSVDAPAAPQTAPSPNAPRTDQPNAGAPAGGAMGGGMHGGGAGGGGASPSGGGSRPGSGGGWTGTPGSPGAAGRPPSTPDAPPRPRGPEGSGTRPPERPTAAPRGSAGPDAPPRPNGGPTGSPRPTGPDSRGPGGPGAPRTDAPGSRPDAPNQRPDAGGPGSKPDTTKAPDTTKTPDSSKSPDPTKSPDGTKSPDTSNQPDSKGPDTDKPKDGADSQREPDTTDKPKDGTDSQSEPDGPDKPKDDADKPHEPDADKPEPGTPEYDQKINDGADTLDNNRTDAGTSGHTDPNMQDLAHRVPDDGKHFTVDAHMGPDGRIDIGGRSYSPDEFADVLRRSGWDGQSPIRLVSCNSGDFAGDLAKKLGVDVTAPRGMAWTDTNGNVFAGSRASDGGPTWPPDGGWDTHHPDGTNSPASDDAFHPSRDGEDIGDRPDDAEARGNQEKLSEEEIKNRKEALSKSPHDNKYYLYGGGHEARLRDGQSGPPLRWDENSNGWVQREGTLEPTPDTPDHLRDDHTYMRWTYEGDRPAISEATKHSVYQNTEMNPDGSYKCAASGKPIPVGVDDAGKPQFYERVGTPPNQQLRETEPPDWYTRGEEPPAPPHDKFTVPKQEEVDGKHRSVADMGHMPDYEYWRQREFAIHHEVTRDQYKAMYDHPDHYRLELKSENQKHSHESTAPGFGKYPQLFEKHFQGQQLQPISTTPVDPQTIVKGGPKLGDPRR